MDTGDHAGTMRVKADLELCCGAGMCVLAAPSVFGQSDDTGLVVLLTDAAADREGVLRAVDTCPSGAISVSLA